MSDVVRWESAASSHAGKRRQSNEDSVLARPEVGLWVVADGMGGHDAGDFASQAVTDGLALVTARGSLAQIVDEVDDLLSTINAQLRDHASSCGEGRVVGSTVVTLVSNGDVGVALWAGDSRLYRLREGRMFQITRDHNPMAELLDDGLIGEQTARKRDSNIVTRAVGGQGQLFLDVAVFDVRPGDTFLLCSDGLYRELSDSEIANLLVDGTVQQRVEWLIEASLARGARDNVSTVVISRVGG
jgi:serine/threonine protein phosphatase PrpC